MPEEMNDEEASLAATLGVTRTKTTQLKKGVAKRKNKLAAMHKVQLLMGGRGENRDVINTIHVQEHVATHLQPPEELISFLQSDDTFEEVVKAAHENTQSLLVRR